MSFSSQAPVWDAVDDLIDRASDLHALRAHRLQLLAARRWRATGRAIPPTLLAEERTAAMRVLTTQALLERITDVCDGPIVLMKGLEASLAYPEPCLRSFGDLDILVPDARRTHRQLVDAGFRAIGRETDYEGKYHLAPLVIDSLPVRVEVHQRPKWLDGRSAPAEAVIEESVPSATRVPGLSAPAPEHHALLVAVHAWSHEPLRRIGDLVDIAAFAVQVPPGRLARTAAAFGVGRLWATTERSIAAVLGGGSQPWPLKTFARNLAQIRERTVFEAHVERWLSDFAAYSTAVAIGRIPRTLSRELGRSRGESRRSKASRVGHAVRNARLARSAHDRRHARVESSEG